MAEMPDLGIDQASPNMLDPDPKGTGDAHARHHDTPHWLRSSRLAPVQAAFCFSM